MTRHILHITPHMGGGVGRVLKGLTLASQRCGSHIHEIACLDYANAAALSWSLWSGVPVTSYAARKPDWLAHRIISADIVQLHWWNHPLQTAFLHRADWPSFRAVMWAHVNGFHAPHQVSPRLLEYPDLFVLGTPYSHDVPAIQTQSSLWKSNHLRSVFASPGYEHVTHISPRPHAGFHIGYIGTVDYAKMHSGYLRMNAAAELPDAKFIVCGGKREVELRQEASQLGLAHRFDIRGQVSDVGKILSELDIFGYPLRPHHYGASEVALIEAMVCGVVPVVMNNGCESLIVRHRRTGLVTESPGEYSRALRYLYMNPDVRRDLSAAARRDARARFHLNQTVDAWHRIYDELLERPKRQHRLSRIHRDRPRAADLFFNALGDRPEASLMRQVLADPHNPDSVARLNLLDPIFHGCSNGSPRQYLKFFPRDAVLQQIDQLLSRAERLTRTAA